MLGCTSMFAGVMIGRTITTECHATRLACAQMDPVRADLYAFFAFAALRLFDRLDRVEMRAATIRHWF
jgi:hypothetical protein